MRKAVHEGLSKPVAESFKVSQLHEAILLTSGLLAQPVMWDNHLRRTTASVAMAVTYDTAPIASELDSKVKAINDFVARLTRAALPGAHFVEFFPWMRRIPSRWGAFKMKPSLNNRGADLPNGSAMQSIGMRRIQRCLWASSMVFAKSWSDLFLMLLNNPMANTTSGKRHRPPKSRRNFN